MLSRKNKMNTKQTVFITVLCTVVLILGTFYITSPQTFSSYLNIEPGRGVSPYQPYNICVETGGPVPPRSDSNSEAKFNAAIQAIVNNLLELRTKLLAIWRYSRGERVRQHTRDALEKLEKQLRTLGVTTLPAPFDNPTHRRSEDVCPEKRTKLPAKKPHDMIDKFFETETCSYGKPLQSLVTVALNFAGTAWDGIDTLRRVISGIRTYNNALAVVIAISKDNPASQIPELNAGIEVVQIPKTGADNAGKIWNKMIEKTKTPYILIGRALEWFTNDVKLERLIREITELGVSIVAGSSRTLSDGHWALGCHQTDLRNYTLKYEAGYFKSMHECMFCDYITGPFVARTETLLKLKFDEISFTGKQSEGLFEDLFFRLHEADGNAAVCPDSMFFHKGVESSNKKTDWQAFSKKWKFSRLVNVGGHDLKYTCQEISVTCPRVKGVALAPCCLQDLIDALKFLSRFCAENNMICQSIGGTTLGAIKFNSVLPWERDGDIIFLSVNYTKVKSLQRLFTTKGYKISFSDNRDSCATLPGGSGRVSTPAGWGVDFWGVCIPNTDSLEFVQQGIVPTKINIDGEWINANRNPGGYSRDRYGEDIYTHVEHYMTFGGHTKSTYVPGYFTPCPASGQVEKSGCLDQFFPDGTLQFG